MSRGSYPEYGTASAGGPSFGLYQSFVSTANSIATTNEVGNNFKFTPPYKSGTGNCLQLTITYPDGNAPTAISDTVNGSWSTTAAVTASGGSGQMDTSVYLFPNCGAGNPTFTITFGATQIPVLIVFREWYGIATTSPANGTANAGNQTNSGSGISCGSLTPSANSIVVADFHLDNTFASSNPTGFVAGSGFTLLDADIGWVNNEGLPKAGEYIVTSASVNPSITPTGDTVDPFNCVAVALKINGSAGTPPPSTIQVVKFIEQFVGTFSAATWVLQFPTTGNLRFFGTTAPTSQVDITSVTDSEGNTWTNETGTDGVQAFYFANATANPNLKVTLHCSGAGGNQMHGAFWDIANAAASPLGATAQNTATANGLTSVANQPNITPSFTSSLVIAMLSNGLGPTIAITSPSNVYSNILSYTGWTDSSNYSSGDGWAHLYNTSTTAQNWTWSITNQASNSVISLALEFKSK